MKKVKGSVSVFLALTLTFMLSFCFVLIESARENTMLLKADIIFHTGIQSIMAEYHKQLWEQYGLLYIDCSYGGEVPDYEKVKEHLEQYVQNNLGDEKQGFLGMEYEGSRLTEVLLATDFGAGSYYAQAVEAGKELLFVSYVETLAEYFEKLQEHDRIETDLSYSREQVSKTIEDVNGTSVEIKEAVWGIDAQGEQVLLEEPEYKIIAVENPLDNILSANILAKQILSGKREISDAKIELAKLPSMRKLCTGTAQNIQPQQGLLDKIYFAKYLTEHFLSYMDNEAKDTVITCELEYLLAGKSNDAQNIEVVMAKLLAMREVDNYLLLMQNEAKKAQAHALAAGTAAASIAALEPVIYQGILLYWAYEDSVEDLQKLFLGEEIPLLKSIRASSDFCLGYEQYLMLLLLFEDTQKLSMRSMDMIEMTIRQEQEFFRADGCISQAQLEGMFQDTYDKSYTVSGKVQY